MDQDFDFFLANNQPALERRELPAAARECLSGRLPGRLFDYWAHQGLRAYAGGLLWTVDPLEYAEVLALWMRGTVLEGKDDYHVIARSAFGDLRIWASRTGASLTISGSVGYIFVDSAAVEFEREEQANLALGVLFACITPETTDLRDANGKPLFKRACARWGALASDEMYGFEPSLVLGGSKDLMHLRRVKIIAHLEFIAQLQPPMVLDLRRHFGAG